VGMAFCSACNQLGISIVDIQHGMSGRNMRSYGGWDNKFGFLYNTLPSEFLCWTPFDKKAIDEWLKSSVKDWPRVKVSGNLWRNFFLENHIEQFREATSKSIFLNAESKA